MLFPAAEVVVGDYFSLQFPYRDVVFTMSVLVDPPALVGQMLTERPGMYDLWGPLQSDEGWADLTPDMQESIYRGSLAMWFGRLDTYFFSSWFWHRLPVEDHCRRISAADVGRVPPLFATSFHSMDAPELVFADGFLEQYPPQEPDPPGTWGWTTEPPGGTHGDAPEA